VNSRTSFAFFREIKLIENKCCPPLPLPWDYLTRSYILRYFLSGEKNLLRKNCFFACILLFAALIPLKAQTYISVPLGDSVYYALELAQMRGLCAPLPAAKPYSRAKILSAIDEILANSRNLKFGGLSGAEREILEQFREGFSPSKKGLDMQRGAYSFKPPEGGTNITGEFGFGADFSLAGAYYTEGEGLQKAGDARFFVSFKGDLGNQTSYGAGLGMGAFKASRAKLGTYDSYYPGFIDKNHPDTSFINQTLTIYSEPLAYFPYTYKKKWDNHLYYPGSLSASAMESWPEKMALGYFYEAEFAGTFLKDHISYRIARLDREWAGMAGNSSLVLNQTAQPFLGMELTASPFKWLTLSSMTGVLEYFFLDEGRIKEPAAAFQNAFSVYVLELNYKNYLHFDAGSTAIWPKRFELGYIFPLVDNFIYQNSVGDFDNMAAFFSIKGQYPGLGKLWVSFFLDEATLRVSRWFKDDRNMFAFQLGASAHIPWLQFSSVTASYTKNEPYNYTHTREFAPWYGKIPMETNYVNNGRSLGHYLPPNSDEILIRFETMPVPQTLAGLQYQLIRHGADFGSSAVDGSSLWSELTPHRSGGNPVIRKFFLHDGAYQWIHIIKFKGEYSLSSFNVPVKLFAEFGGVYSYFTDIDGPPNSGKTLPYKVVDTVEYPHSFRLIGMLGVQIFPK
jgi:hypothetical protein